MSVDQFRRRSSKTQMESDIWISGRMELRALLHSSHTHTCRTFDVFDANSCRVTTTRATAAHPPTGAAAEGEIAALRGCLRKARALKIHEARTSREAPGEEGHRDQTNG